MKHTFPVLVVLALLAVVSLAWASRNALRSSADLMRRAEEIALFVQGDDPYQDPDMTYPPPALAVFWPLVGPFGPSALRTVWLGLNLAALAVLCGAVLRLWGRHWPAWLQVAFCLIVVASRPVRGGINLGQFHLIPMALMLLAVLAWRARRPSIAGLGIGIALVKPTMSLPFLAYMAARRQWRALAVALGLQGVLLVSVALWLGKGPTVLIGEWLAVAKSQQAAGAIDLPSLLQRGWPQLAAVVPLVSLALLSLGGAATIALRRKSDLALVSFVTFLAAIFSYHRYYDLTLLIPALALTIDRALPEHGALPWPRVLAAIAFAVVLDLPSNPALFGDLEFVLDVAFAVAAYVFLVLTVEALLRGPDIEEGAAKTPDLARGKIRGPWVPGDSRAGAGHQLERASS